MPLPAWMNPTRRTPKGPVNPLDKATIVSIFPWDFYVYNPTIFPGQFRVAKGSYDKPSVLTVGPSSWWREIDEKQPHLEIPVSSVQVAQSVVNDNIGSMLGVSIPEIMPGFFIEPGEWTVDRILKERKPLVDAAHIRQKRWFEELIKMADILWARSNGNPIVISDHMKLAAVELQLKEKAWLKDFTTLKMTNCPACGSLRNPDYPICGVCKTIVDKAAYERLGLKQAV